MQRRHHLGLARMWRKKGPGAPTAGVDRDIWKSSGYGRPGGRMDVDQRTDGWTGHQGAGGGRGWGPRVQTLPAAGAGPGITEKVTDVSVNSLGFFGDGFELRPPVGGGLLRCS